MANTTCVNVFVREAGGLLHMSNKPFMLEPGDVNRPFGLESFFSEVKEQETWRQSDKLIKSSGRSDGTTSAWVGLNIGWLGLRQWNNRGLMWNQGFYSDVEQTQCYWAALWHSWRPEWRGAAVNHASAREKRSARAAIHLWLILETPALMFSGGRDFSSSTKEGRKRGFTEFSSRTAKEINRMGTNRRNTLLGWSVQPVELQVLSGRSLSSSILMSSESLEMSQRETDFFYSFIDTLNLLSDLEPICSDSRHGKQTFSFRASVSFNVETKRVESRGLQAAAAAARSTVVGLYLIIRWMRIWLTGSALNSPRCQTLDRVPEIFNTEEKNEISAV